MSSKNNFAMILAITILAIASISIMLPPASATPKVDITFTASGYSSVSGAVLTVGDTTYYSYNLPVTLSLKPGDTYTVTAVSSITGYDSNVYTFGSWTNGNGLTTTTGTFTVPNAATTVTANYAKSTYTARFSTSGLTNVNGAGNVIQIDGTSYTYYSLGSTSFLWAKGSTHTVTALAPITSYDTPSKSFSFSSWTNGNGLVTASGTFTMPSADVIVTANYARSTVQVTFSTTGLINLNADTVITIDGATYTISDIPNIKFQWLKGSTHSITAVSSITGWDNIKHDFSSWTNGNGLTTNTGTFTTPTSDVVVTAKYTISTTTNYHATFAAIGFAGTGSNIIKIDGETISYSALSSKSYLWAAGSTHSIEALGPIYDYATPAKGYTFSSWTNGNGLVTASGTFTMPSHDVTVTANYAQSTVQVTFSTTGLTNLNTDTVLTVDGTAYSIFDIANFKAQWTKGSTHTVTAVTSITGWDNVKHNFSSWINGNGLISNSGTFTTPSSDVAVTLNYATSSSTAAATALTITCTNSATDNSVTISGTLTSGSCGISGKTIVLTYYDGATWHNIGQTTTCNGAYSYTWTIPTELATGVYPLKASYAGDSCYQASNASGELSFYGVHLQVLPESLGSIVALVACFGGAVVFIKLRSKHGDSA
jgi:uncharacterized repeat protein (TIGR02543 family)